MSPGSLCSRSQAAACGSTWVATNCLNAASLASCSPVSRCRKGSPLDGSPRALSQDEARGGAQGLEVLDVEVVRCDLEPELLLYEGGQLDGEQRVDQSGREQVLLVADLGNVDGAHQEAPDDALHVCVAALYRCVHELNLRIF